MFPVRLSVTAILVVCLLSNASSAQDMPLSQILVEGAGWELVSEGHQFLEGPAANANGELYFTDVPGNAIYRVALDGSVHPFDEQAGGTSGLMFGSDGRLYAARNRERKIVVYNETGEAETLVENTGCNDLVVADDGGIYWTDPKDQKVWYRSADGAVRTVAEGIRTNGIILWGDGGTLVVTDNTAPVLWAFTRQPDGSLTNREAYFSPVRIPPGEDVPRSDGMTIDTDGRLYLASAAGLQVFDTQGRPSGTISKPQDAFLSNVAFGGSEFGTLYATCQDKLYRRDVKVRGIAP